jgi:STE24 endopeptidase
MTSEAWLWIAISAEAISAMVSAFLDALNGRSKPKEPDGRLGEEFGKERHARIVAYARDRMALAAVSALWSAAIVVTAFATGILGALDTALAAALGDGHLTTLAFFGIALLATDLLTAPLQLASTFGVEQRYGFNKTTATVWLGDKLKGWIVSGLVGAALLYALLASIDWLGDWFWLAFSACTACFLILANALYTTLIVPLFNKLTPLPEGDVRSAIETYAKSVEFPIAGIFVMNASKRSTKGNAFFSGFGPSRKIVLYDTLVERHTVEELVAIVAHEVGHAKGRHVLKSLATSILAVPGMAILFSFVAGSEGLSVALGAERASIAVNLYAFLALLTPLTILLGLPASAMSRAHEYEADRYAAGTTSAKAMGDALKRLALDNLSDPYPHPAYVAFHYSHPPLLKRLDALDAVPGGE